MKSTSSLDSFKKHRRRRSSNVSFKSNKIPGVDVGGPPGMEGGDSPSLKVADYFVIAGLGNEPELYRDPEVGDVAPLIDIGIILPLENELCPPDWEYVTAPFTQYSANINWVNPAQLPVYIIIKRGYEKKPICDIDVHFVERKEKAKAGYEYIKTSVGGKPVSLNGHVNRPNKHVYIGYKRCATSSFTDAVTVLQHTTSKKDDPKQGYKSVRLHKSTFSIDSFLTFKLSKLYATTGIFTETLVDRFPKKDNATFPLDLKKTPSFCLPLGVQVEWFRNRDPKPTPQFSTFVLTNEKGNKMYGSSLMFYELVIGAGRINELASNYPLGRDLYPYATKSICVLSRWPSFFGTFHKWLSEIYELSVAGLALTIPIERLISNMLYDVPFPTPSRPTVELTVGERTIIKFEQPLTTQIPISGGTFSTLLQCLDLNNLLGVFYQLLLEENILLISSSSEKLTATAEAFCSLLYPFKWMSPYIPLLPHCIGEELFADYELDCPLPFIIGMKKDSLDMYHVPDRVTQVDLDTNKVILPSQHMDVASYLPKHAISHLHDTLASIYIKFDNKVPGKELELSIQETFLRFQCTLLRGYTEYLLPVLEHKDRNFVNANNLFNVDKFINSRDEYQRALYKKLINTQMFNCYIISRSFISDSDETLEFFDGCMERLDENTPLLYETDSRKGVTVVVQTERMGSGLKPNKLYSYPVFVLDNELFYEDVQEEDSGLETSVISLRTKVEKQKMVNRASAAKSKSNTLAWSRCLLQHVYCVWFLYLPSVIAMLEPGQEQKSQLQQALEIIRDLKTERKTNLEEVCYRILISLSGFYGHPQVAMDTFQHMQELKMSISAVTYGHYHRAVLDSDWTSNDQAPSKHWRTLRLILQTVIAFKNYRKLPHQVSIVNTSSLESIQSSEKNNDSPSDSRFGMCDSGIELDKPLSALKTNSLDKKQRTRNQNKIKENNENAGCPHPKTPDHITSKPPIRRGHTRSVSDVSMLAVANNNHYRQLSDDAGSKTLSRLRSPRFKRNSLMGKSVQDRKGISRNNTNSFRRLRPNMTNSSSTYSVLSIDSDDDPGEFYKRDYEKPDPIMFSLPSGHSEDMDPNGQLRVKLWSSYSCSSCGREIYDEQILAGWGSEESNLSTTCPYCDKPSVAQLYIEVTYKSRDSETEQTTPRAHRESSIKQPVDPINIHISLEGEEENPDSGNISFAMPEPIRRERKTRSGSILADMNPRSIKKKKQDNTFERIEVPYLSPIVLRKEVECVLESDGPTEMVKNDLATSHTILFWNMVWWFTRENLESGLPLCIPHAFKHLHPQKKLCQSVILSTQWTNTEHSLYNNFEELSHNKDLPQCQQLWRVIEHLMQDEAQSACNLFVRHRTEVHVNMYRELLFLGCGYKNNFSPLLYDDEYHDCLARVPTEQFELELFDTVTPTYAEKINRLLSTPYIKQDDLPLKQSEKHCRQMFSWLGLSL